jgi:Mn-dependent DtxR family transcriptional regulator
MENISKKFDMLVETLLVLSKEFKNPLDIADQAKRLGLDPKSVLSTARDILKR